MIVKRDVEPLHAKLRRISGQSQLICRHLFPKTRREELDGVCQRTVQSLEDTLCNCMMVDRKTGSLEHPGSIYVLKNGLGSDIPPLARLCRGGGCEVDPHVLPGVACVSSFAERGNEDIVVVTSQVLGTSGSLLPTRSSHCGLDKGSARIHIGCVENKRASVVDFTNVGRNVTRLRIGYVGCSLRELWEAPRDLCFAASIRRCLRKMWSRYVLPERDLRLVAL